MFVCALGASLPVLARAQATLVGRVLADSGRQPISGAQVSVARLRLTVVSDSAGRFRLGGLLPGDHFVVVRSLGFRADSALLEIEGDEVSSRDFVLKRQAVSLPAQRVTASGGQRMGKLAGFHDRQQMGIGHFIGRDVLERAEGRMLTGDLLAAHVPNVSVKRAQSKAWIATGRAVNAMGGCAFCRPGSCAQEFDRADCAAGASPACYMDVYLDGILVYDDTQRLRPPLFDVNSVPPTQIEAIEVYTSAAQVPAQFNRTSAGCGVMLIWTRI